MNRGGSDGMQLGGMYMAEEHLDVDYRDESH